MHVLVTGGAGFIGSTLVDKLLADGNTVDAVDDLSTGTLKNLERATGIGDRFCFEHTDIRKEDCTAFIASRRPEVIFHLAAQASVSVSVAQPLLDADINIVGTLRVLDAARQNGVRKVVFAASGGTLYGDAPQADLPLSEQYPHAPRSPYGISKRVALDYLRCYEDLYGLDFTALALANVYGPRQNPHGEAGVIAIFANNIASDKESLIYGDGNQTRDFVYVDDVVDAFVRCTSLASAQVLNIGTGKPTSVNDLYATMAAVRNAAPPARHLPARLGEARHNALSPQLANKQLSWEPTTSLEDGVAAVMRSAQEPAG